MDGTDVSDLPPDAVLDLLGQALGGLTPETRKAATFVLENTGEVGVSSIREIADAAGVKPNTFVRMARAVGFEGYEEFREPFRQEIRRGSPSFTDRARWLQSLGGSGQLGELYADMVTAAIRNIEASFARTDAECLKVAGDAILGARTTFVLGVGVYNTNARNFAYLADQAAADVRAIPRAGGVASDDLSRAGPRDVLVAMTSKPYRTEIVEAVELAREAGLTVIAISDSPASPIVLNADHAFVVGTETPQFFPSSVAIIALLETLMAFVVAGSPAAVIDEIDAFHARRHKLGLYVSERRRK